MSPKFVLVLGLLFALSLAVLADTSKEDQTDAIEPQKRGRGGCKHGCCGSYAHGQCSACCPAPADETTDAVEPAQRGGGRRCRHGCCRYSGGRCVYCCPRSNKAASEETTEEPNTVEPQKRGCKHGCCGSYAHGQCSHCCPTKMEKKEEAEAKP